MRRCRQEKVAAAAARRQSRRNGFSRRSGVVFLTFPSRGEPLKLLQFFECKHWARNFKLWVSWNFPFVVVGDEKFSRLACQVFKLCAKWVAMAKIWPNERLQFWHLILNEPGIKYVLRLTRNNFPNLPNTFKYRIPNCRMHNLCSHLA